MHSFEVIERGLAIAHQSGLDELARRIPDSRTVHPLLYVVTSEYRSSSHKSEDDKIRAAAISSAFGVLKGQEERRVMHRGLTINPGEDNWRYETPNTENTLFPISGSSYLLDSTDADGLVISGVVGAVLKNYKARHPILKRSRYGEFGFNNHVEALAFAGAYVVGQIIDNEQKRLFDDPPSFRIIEGSLAREITVDADFHGDFNIGLTKIATAGVVSPTGSRVDFTPKETLWVPGYHSIEPVILSSIITDEYRKNGKEATRQLISEFTESVQDLIDDSGSIECTPGAFADYGCGEVDFLLSELSSLIAKPDYNRRNPLLISTPSKPQSPNKFEVKSLDDGIRFQGRHERGPDPEVGIDVPRSYYADLFRALFVQSQRGIGRSSPDQLMQVLNGAIDILAKS